MKDKLAKKGELYSKVDRRPLTLGYRREHFVRETVITSDKKGEVREDGLPVQGEDPGRSRPGRSASTSRRAGAGPTSRRPSARGRVAPCWIRSRDESLESGSRARRGWSRSWEPLNKIYRRSLVDLAALRFETGITPGRAARRRGCPGSWRCSAATACSPASRRCRSRPSWRPRRCARWRSLQARTDDPFRDAEPGKILHEIRLGEMTAFEDRPQSPYYGAADATMLFLILLEEYERWTGDSDAGARAGARGARGDGLDRRVRRPRQGRLRRVRAPHRRPASTTSAGRTRGTRSRSPTARWRRRRARPASCRATSTTPSSAWRAWRARSGTTRRSADKLDREAEELKRALQPRLLDPRARLLRAGARRQEAQGRLADVEHRPPAVERDRRRGQGRPVRQAPDERRAVLGLGDPHDGVQRGVVQPDRLPRRHGVAARQLVHRLGHAALRLPGGGGARSAARSWRRRTCSTAGCPRRSAATRARRPAIPVEYPTACSPQAWATGAPLLVLRTLLGLDSDGKHLIVDPAIPRAAGPHRAARHPRLLGPHGRLRPRAARHRGLIGDGASAGT